ncbi:MAG: metallophosphoesterase [Dehalococcoidia bacterium]|nr:metallophosphoesterase [Dehalococcoidia bacterium]
MKSARVVLFGDTHLGFDLPAGPRLDRRRRGDDFAANYRRVLRHVEHTRPDAVVHGGDFFFRARVAPAIVEEAFAALAQVADLGIPVFIVPGNHDRSRLPPSLWLGHPDIHVFDRPRTFVVEASGMRLALGGFSFLWGDLRQRFERQLALAGLMAVVADAHLLCMHHTVAGAQVGPNGYTFRAGPDVVPAVALPPTLTGVLAGHIHRAQVLEDGRHPPVIYAGSTERTSFAERNETKGFYDLTMACVPSGRAKVVQADFLQLPSRPMVDVVIPGDLDSACVDAFLTSESRRLPSDAVVRITAPSPPPALLPRLRAANLRAIFPPTINVQLSRELINAFK